MMTKQLAGRVALVTGASRGIGGRRRWPCAGRADIASPHVYSRAARAGAGNRDLRCADPRRSG